VGLVISVKSRRKLVSRRLLVLQLQWLLLLSVQQEFEEFGDPSCQDAFAHPVVPPTQRFSLAEIVMLAERRDSIKLQLLHCMQQEQLLVTCLCWR